MEPESAEAKSPHGSSDFVGAGAEDEDAGALRSSPPRSHKRSMLEEEDDPITIDGRQINVFDL